MSEIKSCEMCGNEQDCQVRWRPCVWQPKPEVKSVNSESLRQPSPQKDVPTFATDSPYKVNPYQSGKASTESKEIMPLITDDTEAQKVLESAQVMMDSMIKLIEKLEAKEKEWAKKEADWLLQLYINMTAIDGRTKEDIQARLDYLAELRKEGK